jgi:hypothetical protein
MATRRDECSVLGVGYRFNSAPAILSYRPGYLAVFIVGTDNNLWQRYTYTGDFMDNQPWTSWGNPGVAIVGNPAVTSWGDQGFVPNTVEFRWRLNGSYAAFSFASTADGVSFAS